MVRRTRRGAGESAAFGPCLEGAVHVTRDDGKFHARQQQADARFEFGHFAGGAPRSLGKDQKNIAGVFEQLFAEGHASGGYWFPDRRGAR